VGTSLRPAAPARRRDALGLTTALTSLVALGVALRVWVQLGDIALLDGDEAVVGLQAMRIAGGDEQTFFLGQRYGGTLEATLASLPMRFETSVWSLRVVPAVLSVVAAALVLVIGRRTLPDRRSATLAAAVQFAWPPVFVWFGTRSLGFYASSLALGLAAVACLVIAADDERRRWPVGLGLAAGLAWWQAPYLVYFAVPAGLWWIGHAGWRALPRLWPSVPAFVVGALPWLAANVGNGFPSLDAGRYPAGESYLAKVWYSIHTGLPLATGLKLPFNALWSAGAVGRTTYLAVAAVIGVSVVLGLARRRLWAFGLAAFPLLFAMNPLPPTAGHGRYFLFLSPWLALLVGELASRSRAALGAGFVALGMTTALGVHALDSIPWRVLSRPATEPVAEVLLERGTSYAFTEYFTAYKLVFESEEAVLATPYTAVRDPAIDAAVRDAPRPAYVFTTVDPALTTALAGLERLAVDFDRVDVDGYVVLFPERRVLPEELSPTPLGT
jgi:hypothetical protein